MNDMKSFYLNSSMYNTATAMPWSGEDQFRSGGRASKRGRNNAPMLHSDQRTDLITALVLGLKEFADRKHTRFKRGDIVLLVRPEYRWLNLFRLPGFHSVKLNDISICGASFSPTSPIRSKWVSLRVQFGDDVEFLLSGRMIGQQGGNVHRVKFLDRNEAFADHLVKSSLNLRFHDSECFGETVAQPA